MSAATTSLTADQLSEAVFALPREKRHGNLADYSG